MAVDSSRFPGIKLYTFGAMSLGSDLQSIEAHVAVARQAMDAGVWFHASPSYHRGFCFMILRMAFDQERSKTPRMIIKIRDASPELLRFEVEDSCRRLGLDGIDCIQLVAMETGQDGIAADLACGGPVSEAIRDLKGQGLVKACELFLRKEDAGAMEKAWPSGMLDGATFYWNAAQRSCADEDWDFIQRREVPTLALRTLAGGDPQAASAVHDEKLKRLVAEVGCGDWTELNLRYAATDPNVVTTIGGTANSRHLERYLELAESSKPFDEATARRIDECREELIAEK